MTGQAERKPNRRRSFNAGSCAYDYLDTTEICCVAGGGIIKGKSAIHIVRMYFDRKKNYVGQSFWARGYFVSTVGRDEELIRNYIRHQEQEDRRLEQLKLM